VTNNLDGVTTRIAQRLLALAAVVWHNWTTGAPDKRRHPLRPLNTNFTESTI